MKEAEKKAIASLTMAGMASLALGTGPIGILVATGAAIFPIAKWHLFSNLQEEIIDSLPDDVKLYLPTVSLALDQMKKDIERSPLLSPALLSTKEKAVQDELGVLDPKENMTPKEHIIERLFAGRIWGIPSDEDVALLREMCSGPEPLRVECQSVCVGAYATFVSMRKRHAVEFEIDPSAASGVETAVTQSHRDDDILVTADAPMILGKSRFSFQKEFTVTTELQSVLAKAGGDAREQKSLFIYPDSSVEHQLYLMHESQFRDRFQFPVNVREVPIYDLSDYIQLDRIMDEGDYVLAWDPLRTKLMTLDIFDEVPNTTFELPISLFSADSSRFSRNHIDALLRLFIAEMNFVGSNKLFAWSALLSDRPFRESLVRGAALNFDRDRTSTD